jgi:hypothetical protein
VIWLPPFIPPTSALGEVLRSSPAGIVARRQLLIAAPFFLILIALRFAVQFPEVSKCIWKYIGGLPSTRNGREAALPRPQP